MTTTTLSPPIPDAVRASDADRDIAFGLLRDHWLAGRLSLDEYEARCDEAAAGRFLDDLRGALRELPYPLPEHARTAPPLPAPAAASPDGRTHAGGALTSLMLGPLSLLLLVATLGFGVIITLPMSAIGWSLAHRALRSGRRGVRAIAIVGEVFAVLATALGGLVALGWTLLLVG